jgi:hypothetical protein
MKRFEERFEPWDPVRFSLIGAAFGLLYGLAMGAVVGVYTLATLDLLIWGVTSTTLFAAAVTGGVAVLRNHVADRLTQSREQRARRSRDWVRHMGSFLAVLRPREL